MILGRSALIECLRDRSITVSPILSADQVGAASIDLRMGNVVLMVRSRGASHVDPKATSKMTTNGSVHDIETERQQKHERHEIPFNTKFLLHPGALALVPTLEWIKCPANIMGMVTARSTWAREGLNIATANIIEPNYNGIVTLELANFGQIPLALYPGLRIAQISFFRVEGTTTRPNKGQFELSFEPVQGAIAKKEDSPFLID